MMNSSPNIWRKSLTTNSAKSLVLADYLKNALIAYQAGTLRNDFTGAMPDIAQRMSTAEIKAVSDYAAGLR